MPRRRTTRRSRRRSACRQTRSVVPATGAPKIAVMDVLACPAATGSGTEAATALIASLADDGGALTAPDARRRRPRLADPPPGLDRGLLVGADNEVAGLKQIAFPAAGVEIEDRAG